MGEEWLWQKALFMIVLVISMSVVFSVGMAAADEEEEEAQYCCEKLDGYDQWCVYTDASECDSGYDAVPSSCEQTSYCEVGVCVSDAGICSDGVAKGTCDGLADEGYAWYAGTSDDIEQCQQNCCVIADYQCAYTTENNCEILLENFEDVEKVWEAVDSEASCTNICQSADRGCCVTEDSCTYTTQADCETYEIDVEDWTGFFDGTYCSNLNLECGCEAHDTLACVDEDIYWFDSCGNQEEIASETDAYSDGTAVGELNPYGSDGDCSYIDGNWCGFNDDPDVYNYQCLSIDCEGGTFDGLYYIDNDDPGERADEGVQRNPHGAPLDDVEPGWSEIGGNRAHGEAWCLYESPAGGFKDFPGSQQYRSFCYFGEEIIEPCGDFREEVCLQFPYNTARILNEDGYTWDEWTYQELTGDRFEGPTGSRCIDNTDNEIFNPNVSTVAVGGSFWSSSYADTCSVADTSCDMLYARTNRADTGFEQGTGIMCTSPQWAKTLSDYCNSLGDCGVGTSLVGEYTHSGFSLQASQEFLSKKDDPTKRRVYVGYDTCVDHFVDSSAYRSGTFSNWITGDKEQAYDDMVEAVNDFEQEAVFCMYDCDEKNGACNFVSTIDEELFYAYWDGGEASTGEVDAGVVNLTVEVSRASEYFQRVAYSEDDVPILYGPFPALDYESDLGQGSYGVYGGLVGLSQLIEQDDTGGVPPHLTGMFAVGITNIAGSAMTLLGAGVLTAAATKAGTEVASSALTNIFATTFGQTTYTYSSAVAAEAAIFTSAEADILIAGGEVAKGGGSNLFATIGSVITIITTLIGWAQIGATQDPLERQAKSKAFAITSGIAAGVTLLAMYVAATGAGLGPVGWIVSIVALVVAGVSAFLATGGETTEVSVVSSCEAWQAVTGGDYCELCDLAVSEGGLAIDDGEGNVLSGYECTEYKCRSLGQRCEFIEENAGTTRAKCIEVAENDVNHPAIVKFMVVLPEDMSTLNTDGYVESASGFDFVEDEYLLIGEIVIPYQSITFGIETDEPSQCKIELGEYSDSYEAMSQYYPDSYFDYQHNETWILTPEAEWNFWVRCEDAAGNHDEAAFEIQMTTDEGLDVTPPSIEGVDPKSGGYAAANLNESKVYAYLDSCVEGCRWSSNDIEYDQMNNTFVCGACNDATSLWDNECYAYLNVSEELNSYYFACEDKAGNMNTENYAYTLQSSDPLLIDYAIPNGTIYYDYVELGVGTSAGAEDGKAVCYYDGIEFYQTNASTHTQPFEDLAPLAYELAIDCVDIAGNSNSTTITFEIDVDTESPELAEIYVLGDTVYFATDEDTECEYYFEEFVYGEGTSVEGSFVVGDFSRYYLVCQDVFENEAEYIIEV